MKIKFYSIAFLFAISLIFASCRKDNKPNEPNNNIDNFLDLKVSESFAFESFSNLSTDIKIPMTKASSVQIIQIYDADPAKGGKLILTGSVNETGEFKLPIRIASRLTEVYVGKLSSTGNNEFVPAAVVGSKIQLDFTNTKSTDDNDPCTTGCDLTITSNQENLIVTSGEVVCVLAGTNAIINGLEIEAGGTFRVCGSVTVNSYLGGGGSGSGGGSGGGGNSGTGLLLINDQGTVNLPKNNVDLEMEIYGNLNFSGSASGSATKIKGDIQNWGDISSTIKLELEATLTNDGTISTSQEFKIKESGTLINNCQFYNTANDKEFKNEGTFTNNGYLKVANKAKFDKKAILGQGSLIETKDFEIKKELEGPSSAPYASITASDKGKVTKDGNISGYVDLCANNTEYDNRADYGTNVTYCDNDITTPPICSANVAPTITSSLQLGGLVNEDITPYVMTATGTETINYTMESLPAGLSWVAATHTIIGTPTTAGTYNVDMTASNVMGSDTKTLVITITEPTAPPVITSVLTDETTVNQSYTYTITATGEPDITYTATNLPAGLSFTGPNQITGVPTAAGTYNITLEATNGGGTTQEILELTVGTPPEITSWLTASGTAGVQFNAYTLTATGDATITYSMASLPQGLSFDANTQTVNGTPLYSGVYNVTMTAINDYGTDIETLVITINEGAQPPEITSSLTENAMKDFHYSYSITADGSQPMTFNVSTDDLPDGLTFDGSTISGIPTGAGTFNIPLTATNGAGTDNKTLVLIIGTGGGNDTDGDGIPDNLDAYPLDPTRAFNSYYPNETDFGSFAFEDLWPGYGDYDFNDFVVNFNYKIVTNAQNNVVDVITKFQIMAAGASLNNGFGIVFDAPSSTVESVTGCLKFGNAVQIDPKGYEVGHTNTTVIIPFDAINPIMEGGMVNTIPGGKYIQTTVNMVTTHFGTPQASIGTPPFNPFIFVDQERGHEIHLKNQPPTNLVDPYYFDTYHDVSNPGSGTYYVSETGLPWGIEVPVNFNYPVEKADILTAYLKFAAWAQSEGVEFPDWYEDKSGYRNDANIYVVPQ